MGASDSVRTFAFYLPQFHPIPENDEWWGPGFTEWTNVAKARPLFRGHRQPDIPADLGFYDLRLADARQAQSDLAREYHVDTFVYWHYWFGGGRRILERPFQEVLRSGAPEVGFALAWANQTWTGIWHGASDRVLVQQEYPGDEDDKAHFDTLLPAFRDPRYARVGQRPVFYVFRPEQLPNAARFVDRWQAMARAAGLDGLYLVAEVSDLLGRGPVYQAVERDGFDAGVYMRMPARLGQTDVLRMRFGRKVLRRPEIFPYATSPIRPPAPFSGLRYQPCVYPNWDNSPRSGRGGIVLRGATPELFGQHVRSAVTQLRDHPAEERILWVKSWNEWAEGNHLEPDQRFGREWLRVLAAEVAGG